MKVTCALIFLQETMGHLVMKNIEKILKTLLVGTELDILLIKYFKVKMKRKMMM